MEQASRFGRASAQQMVVGLLALGGHRWVHRAAPCQNL